MVLIGVVGRMCSGKEEISLYIEKYWNFKKEKLSFIDFEEIFNIYLMENNKKKDQKNLDFLKKFFSYKKEAYKKCQEVLLDFKQDQIVYPITSMEQITFLRKRNYFHLVHIDSPILERFKRFTKKYKSLYLKIDLVSFLKLDDFIYSNFIARCIEEANYRIENFSDLPKLFDSIEKNKLSIARPFRPDWDTYFMKVAFAIKSRSNCMKRSVGAIIVQHNRIIATGYNGTPIMFLNCYDGGCERCNSNAKQGSDLEKCMCIHAEESALLEIGIKAAKRSTVYTTLFPCFFCAKLLAHSGVSRVVYGEEFSDMKSKIIFDKNNIKVEKHDVVKYLYNI